ncbi:toll/interleukin-1 receptor-like protein [Durio zibethinus]|uniref:Toll/interleukin-1 receptor-like protein n=1 Tax=Durio zibethinus TaxID=66656 RepID=A0A6P6AH93_DURZI|nr:toll/interleukin-1 receptor-like protein [Durio zibethinus]
MSSSSSSSIYPWKYDIFLSFRGKETRKSFVHHLYVALNRNGINTFRDDNNIRRGEDIALELLETIGESWGSIIVFSEGYAFSSWCLDELVEIVKQRNERGHQVYPIFYNVEVSDLKYQRGRVHEAFGMHEERCKDNKKKMQRWRDALSQVADISGWLLKDQYESIFIEDIVKKISTKLSQTYSQLKHLNSKFNIGQDDVRTIGVCGTSGTRWTICIHLQHWMPEQL